VTRPPHAFASSIYSFWPRKIRKTSYYSFKGSQQPLHISSCGKIAVRVTSLLDSLARSGTVISKWDFCNFLKLQKDISSNKTPSGVWQQPDTLFLVRIFFSKYLPMALECLSCLFVRNQSSLLDSCLMSAFLVDLVSSFEGSTVMISTDSDVHR
jgi:hypothetical protein